METETEKQEFLRLLDRAIVLGKAMLQEINSPSEQIDRLISELEQLKVATLNDRLSPSQGVITLGLARQVADWIESLDSLLLKALGEIELYYQQHF